MIKPKVSGRSLKRLHILPLFFVPTAPIAKLFKEAVFRLHSSVVAINSFCQPLRLFASTSGRTFHKTIKAVEYLCCTKIFLIITGQPSLTWYLFNYLRSIKTLILPEYMPSDAKSKRTTPSVHVQTTFPSCSHSVNHRQICSGCQGLLNISNSQCTCCPCCPKPSSM